MTNSNILFHQKEVEKILQPLLKGIIGQYRPGETTIIAIQGGQGTGKTTLNAFLKNKLNNLGYKTKAFSLDDFYETYEYRKKLAKKYQKNVFYAIPRGLPGTHRIAHLKETLQKIKLGQNFSLPIFDKSLHHATGDMQQRT